MLTSYDGNGGYGHPDHVAVHRIGALAAERAGTPVAARGDRAAGPAAARRPSRQPGCCRGHGGSTSRRGRPPTRAAAEVTHRIDVRPQRRHRRASMRAHASQATADTGVRTLQVFTRIPPPLFGWVFGREWYRQPGVRPPARRYAGVFDTLSG